MNIRMDYLGKDGLGKDMNLSDLPTDYVQQVASYRNNIPRKKFKLQTPTRSIHEVHYK